MKALLVYESMYGNTAAIGEAIATSLRARGLEVDAGPVSKVDPARADEVDLLLVGGPTHVHGLSTTSTRKTAAADAKNTFPEATLEPGLRTWIKQLPPGMGRLAAAFDTRIDKPALITGSAAKGIGRRLKGRGFQLARSSRSCSATWSASRPPRSSRTPRTCGRGSVPTTPGSARRSSATAGRSRSSSATR